MQIPVSDIVVKKRIRKDMGDIPALAESMRRCGQITPILISKNNVLVAGERRLEAARSLGWRTINAVIAEASGPLALFEMEVEENIQRRDFTAEEEACALRQLYRMRNPGFFRRLWNAIRDFFKKLFRID
ncbi:MAG: ParB N-terminal domain-containing protein [Treponema sp.]|nr:ParB N-terminal domain-containing protein [Treponema sp.]